MTDWSGKADDITDHLRFKMDEGNFFQKCNVKRSWRFFDLYVHKHSDQRDLMDAV